jgi:hypothetical protein
VQLGLDELGQQLVRDGRDAWVRLLAVRTDEGWRLHYCWALVGAEPPGWQDETWQYAQVLLLAVKVRTAALKAVCTAEEFRVGEFALAVPSASGPGNGERRPSFSPHDEPPLPMPVTEWRIAASDSFRQVPTERCVGVGDTPSFFEPNSAWHAFSQGDFAPSRIVGPPTDLAKIRIMERDARIGRVVITATQISVDVLGDDVAGAELELFAAHDRQVRQIDAAGTVRLSLPRGLPAGAWLWLKRDGDWLDYRTLDPRHGGGDLAASGVEVEAPVDPQSVIEALLAVGEGPQVEYKEYLPSPKDRRTLKSVAAFANGDGGTLVFGVNRDEVTVVGVSEDQPVTKLRDDLVNLVRGSVVPMPQVSAQHFRVDGHLLITLTVEPGQSPPYGLSLPTARDKPEYFVRRGASSYPALPGELREAALSRNPPVADQGFRRW